MLGLAFALLLLLLDKSCEGAKEEKMTKIPNKWVKAKSDEMGSLLEVMKNQGKDIIKPPPTAVNLAIKMEVAPQTYAVSFQSKNPKCANSWTVVDLSTKTHIFPAVCYELKEDPNSEQLLRSKVSDYINTY